MAGGRCLTAIGAGSLTSGMVQGLQEVLSWALEEPLLSSRLC